MNDEEKESKKSLFVWRTRDIVIAAVISVAVGLIHFAYGSLYLALSGALGNIWVMLFLGFYYITGILVAYVIRKPGAAFFASVLAAFVQLLVGSPFGIAAVFAGMVQGAGAEAVFAAFRHRNYRFPVLALASVASGAFAFVFEFFYLSYGRLEWWVPVAYFFVRIPSAVILAGLLGKLLADALAKTGVIRLPKQA